MKRSCKQIVFATLMLSLTLPAFAGSAASKAKRKPKAPAAATAEDIQALRDALAAQQKQIDELRQELQQRDESIRRAQEAADQAQHTVTESSQKTSAAADQSGATMQQLQSDVKDLKTNQASMAVQTQEDQKKFSALEGALTNFKWSGDVRVRQEDFIHGCDVAPGCNFRQRERVRLRLGLTTKLNEDFTAGMFLASGAQTDPTSTNETLTNVFERKNIAFDRGYIIYNPHQAKWLELTGGKFAYTWKRTPFTFDSDLNPEGFSEKLNFDLANAGILKNVNFTGMQLLFNESGSGADSYAVGGQVGTKIQLGDRVTVSPSYSLLNWHNADILLNEPGSVTGKASAGAFAPNGVTNATVTNNGVTSFASKFLYSDFILDVAVKTPWKRFPWGISGEFEQNLNAVASAVTGTSQDKSYGITTTFGQQKDRGDFQLSYSWYRQEQDAVIAAFNQSDQRAPTNVLQHQLIFDYKIRKNVTAEYTTWIGRTLNTALPNALIEPGTLPGQKEPYLKRLQFDVIYSF